MQILKVGTGVNIVFENEINKKNAHNMRAMVYDYNNSKVVVSQSSPPLTRNFLNRRVVVTFLADFNKHPSRFGFAAQLIDLKADYQISADKGVEALVLKKLEKIHRVDYRMFFRVKLPSKSNINLYFQNKRVNLINISLGGAKFSYPLTHLFRHGEALDLQLIIDSTAFEMKAKVRNLSHPHEFSVNNTLQYVGIEFEGGNRQLEVALGKAIIEIERQMLSEGKIV